MIADLVILEVLRLLKKTGLSHQKIADQTGISTTSVNAIARGELKPRGNNNGDSNELLVPKNISFSRKCLVCGRSVNTNPCYICLIRLRKQIQMKRHRQGLSPLNDNQLDLATLDKYELLERENAKDS